MASSTKEWKFKNIFCRTKFGCGCGPKALDIIQPNPKPSQKSLSMQPNNMDSPETVSLCPKIHDSSAVVKRSSDPYSDFRNSMLQMIYEYEIYSRKDLQQLLECFLRLNPPHHHGSIVKAFIDIWNACLVERAEDKMMLLPRSEV